ncbi:MAG TPA: hypothetical protein VGR38_04615 [Candidatus Polarisedimenticolia bacterium]|nr:hypothetical protein [Candidatus Polarisedimenticolia bacterium]
MDAAGLEVQLQGLAAEDASLLKARYGPFVREPGSPDRAHVEVVEAEVSGFLRPFEVSPGRPEIYRLEQHLAHERLVAYSYDFAGFFDYRERAGKLAIAAAKGDPFHRAVENYLRVVAAHAALREGGLLLHASGVVRNGSAHLFFGPSGSGKTTVTLFSEGDLILGDDLILIRRGKAGFEACAVPFRGLYREPPQTDRAFPLSALYRLVQDREDFLEDLPVSRALAEMMASLPFVMEAAGGARALEVAGALAQSVRIQRLHFTKSADFWRLVA